MTCFSSCGFKPRTKGGVIGFNEGDEDDEGSDTESNEPIDINSNVKFLPATADGLTDRLNQLFKETKIDYRN